MSIQVAMIQLPEAPNSSSPPSFLWRQLPPGPSQPANCHSPYQLKMDKAGFATRKPWRWACATSDLAMCWSLSWPSHTRCLLGHIAFHCTLTHRVHLALHLVVLLSQTLDTLSSHFHHLVARSRYMIAKIFFLTCSLDLTAVHSR
jgi:hypothetical protein